MKVPFIIWFYYHNIVSCYYLLHYGYCAGNTSLEAHLWAATQQIFGWFGAKQTACNRQHSRWFFESIFNRFLWQIQQKNRNHKGSKRTWNNNIGKNLQWTDGCTYFTSSTKRTWWSNRGYVLVFGGSGPLQVGMCNFPSRCDTDDNLWEKSCTHLNRWNSPSWPQSWFWQGRQITIIGVDLSHFLFCTSRKTSILHQASSLLHRDAFPLSRVGSSD